MESAALTKLVDYDFMKCEKCGRIVTKPEVLVAIGPGGNGQACPCGSMKFLPMNLPWWGWFLPRVWKFAYHRVKEQGIRETLRRAPKVEEVNHGHLPREAR